MKHNRLFSAIVSCFSRHCLPGLLLLFVATAQVSAEPPQQLADTFQADASLHDITFVDQQHGWAVGDHGVIWSSDDGGDSWTRQASPVNAPLWSVTFIDPRRGWIAGSTHQPYTRGSYGFILQTNDGGNNWQVATKIRLPGLRTIKFFDRRRGVAVGAASYVFPTGVFTTSDAGRTWNPAAGDGARGWIAATFQDSANGFLLDVTGQVAKFKNGSVTLLGGKALPTTCYDLLAATATSGWIVGDDASLLFAPHMFSQPESERPGEASPGVHLNAQIAERLKGYIDFRAIARTGNSLWIAGQPGSQMLHSSDGGVTWEQQPTDVTVPLQSMTFVDPQHGWAVGELGTIVKTDDGGKTWSRVQSGGRRAAIYALFPTPSDVPWQLIAKLAAEDGYFVVIEVVDLPEENSPHLPIDRDPRAAFMQAASALGAHAVPPAKNLSLLPRQNLARHLARQLRTWRPDLVITPARLPLAAIDAESHPKRPPLAESMLKGIELAADPLQMPALASHVGLQPWQVKKHYALASPLSRRGERLDVDRLSPQLSASLDQWTVLPRSLVEADFQQTDQPIVTELLANFPGAGEIGAKLLDGNPIPGAHDARRKASAPSIEAITHLGHVAEVDEQLADLARIDEPDSQWATRAVGLTGGLSADAGATLLLRLAHTYKQHGKRQLAADTLYLLIKRYPQHPLFDYVLRDLVQFYCSQEIERQLQGPVALELFAAPIPTDIAKMEPVAEEPTSQATEPIADDRVTQATHESVDTADDDVTQTTGNRDDPRLQRAILLTQFMQQHHPLRVSHPEIALPIESLRRRNESSGNSPIAWSSLKRILVPDPWKNSIQQLKDLESAPLSTPPCRMITASPLLDGLFSEACWRSETFHIATEQVNLRAVSDGRFLFLAIRCPHLPGVEYRPESKSRPRDADLSRRDHVTLEIDVDCDVVTTFQFQVDHRGWTHDAVAGDSHWNPTWYVAAGDDGNHWKIEAAIPLGELVDRTPDQDSVWQIACSRQIPSAGQRMTIAGAPHDTPASTPRIPQFHLVRFAPETSN